jgi:hypothetical protein
METLRETLVRTKVVISPLIFDVLRVASKVSRICTKCNAIHHIHFYHPGRATSARTARDRCG